jgi:hypothetical protein
VFLEEAHGWYFDVFKLPLGVEKEEGGMFRISPQQDFLPVRECLPRIETDKLIRLTAGNVWDGQQ